MEISEALTTALDFEQKGHEIYKKHADKTKNPLVKKTLHYLAGQELIHIMDIKKFMEQDNPTIEKGDAPEDVKKFFTMTTDEFKEKLSVSDEDKKVYEKALDLEQSSYDFYKEQSENADNETVVNFFEFLMSQEMAHHDLIQKTLSFLEDPESFFESEEKWFFEGG